MIETIIKSIASIIEVSIASIAFYITVKEYLKNKRSKIIRQFIDQITAYYSEEQEAIKWIGSLSQNKIPNIQQKLRKKATTNENNPSSIYPKMTPKQAENYLC